ncbi:hypothetical protein [Gordonibacter sp. An230]|uniref:hypothetical protein n=1 Tax=Gordonibacter sp. An230 TaxID=1965592 RepID=UPI0011208D7F|nr:hypothetical protein [Gordonibacter sp. An230]
MRNERGALRTRHGDGDRNGLGMRKQHARTGHSRRSRRIGPWTACGFRNLRNDLEDNLIAAAQRLSAMHLIADDELLVKHAPVAALTSHDALALLQATQQTETKHGASASVARQLSTLVLRASAQNGTGPAPPLEVVPERAKRRNLAFSAILAMQVGKT